MAFFAGGIPTVGSFGSGSGPTFLNNVGCFGSETNILDCWSSGIAIIANCGHAQDVGVVCSGEFCTCLYNESLCEFHGGVCPSIVHEHMPRELTQLVTSQQ